MLLLVGFTGTCKIRILFLDFMVLDFMTNLGPNGRATCRANEVLLITIRGSGAGFTAALGKRSAIATTILFHLLLDVIGMRYLLYGLLVTSLLGRAPSWLFRMETAGVILDQFGEAASQLERTGVIA